MAKSSTMLELGTPAPPFALPDTEGRTVSLDDARGAPALLVMFHRNHCPYVQHVRGELARGSVMERCFATRCLLSARSIFPQ